MELDLAGPRRLIVSSAGRGLIPSAGRILSVPVLDDGSLGEPRAMQLPNGPPKLHPVGISLVPAHDREPARLYVINKARRPTIEKFELAGDRLVRVETIRTDGLLADPNDLLATADDQIYVSNVSTRKGLRKLWGQLARRRDGNLVHIDAQRRARIATPARPISFANGIALSLAGDRLFVSAFLERALLVFDRDPVTGTLGAAPRAEIRLPAHPDNLTWSGADAGTGIIVAACHESVPRTGVHLLLSQRIPAPSAVYSIDTRAASPSPELLLRDDGSRLSASSTAIWWGDSLYVSQLRRPTICRCRRGPGCSDS